MANIELQKIYKGKKYTIYAIVNHDKCRFQTFLDKQSESDQKKIVALLERKGDKGYIKNTQKFKKLKGEELHEFKPSKQIRILCFFDEEDRKLIILTHGFIKKSEKTPKKEIEKAKNLKKLHYTN